jgi:hypothetical protein
MRSLFLLLGLCLYTATVAAQEEPDVTAVTDSIVREARQLYRSEMASWYGTDIFMERFAAKKEQVGGYFSYRNNDLYNCIFFSKGDHPKVLATISFDSTYDVNRAIVYGEARDFTPEERTLHLLRQKTSEEINRQDGFFKGYQNSRLNIVPILQPGVKKVYVLTAPYVNGVVLFGNDYLLTFGDDNQLLTKRRLHQSLITTELGDSTKKIAAGVHNHLPETGDFITATDICTLMSYQSITNWEQYYVISEKYVSIWDCRKRELVALTREAWEKIMKDHESRRNK